jgi:FlaA1/EpsC-like NDP-sugar epimerase
LTPDRAWNRLLQGSLRRGPSALIDCLAVATIYLATAAVRTGANVPTETLSETVGLALIGGLLQVASNIFFQVYWRDWSAAALEDLVALVKSTAVSFVVLFLIDSVLPVRPIPYAALAGGVFAVLFVETAIQLRPRWGEIFRGAFMRDGSAQNVVIVGAGRAGQLFARDLHQQNPRIFNIVAFVDDDHRRWGSVLRGTRVVGSVAELGKVFRNETIDLVVIAIADPPSELIRRVVAECEPLDIRVRAVAGMRIEPSDTQALRPLSIDELLGRDPIALDAPIARAFLAGRTVLVTGAAGSIGSELVKQAAECDPAKLIALDVNENGLFELRERSRSVGRDLAISLTDIRDRQAIARVLNSERPDVVIHAAAYKHVPILEEAVAPAILTNVVGTANVLQAAIEADVGRLVFISSDKAVRPTSVLGLTKRLGEMLTIAYAHASKKSFSVVRFGNVLGSSGSVVPIFERQIDQGGPVTVTHPDATRFFMTIPEAVALVIQAGAIAQPADLLVLDMEAPLSIANLARKMIRLRGLRTPTDIPIAFVGLRPGEKLHEELFFPFEQPMASQHARVLRVHSSLAFPSVESVLSLVPRLEQLAREGDPEEASLALRLAVRLESTADNRIVPERASSELTPRDS